MKSKRQTPPPGSVPFLRPATQASPQDSGRTIDGNMQLYSPGPMERGGVRISCQGKREREREKPTALAKEKGDRERETDIYIYIYIYININIRSIDRDRKRERERDRERERRADSAFVFLQVYG